MPPLVRDVALPLLLTLLLQTSAMPLLLLFSNRILQVVLVWSPLLLLPLVPVLLPLVLVQKMCLCCCFCFSFGNANKR
jgi:hypothetical protein